MAEPALRRMKVDEFLSWDDGTDTRYELVGGFVVAMAPPAARHSLLSMELGGEIRTALRARPPCRVYSEAGIIHPAGSRGHLLRRRFGGKLRTVAA
jgi:Uma2 family endonuclease